MAFNPFKFVAGAVLGALGFVPFLAPVRGVFISVGLGLIGDSFGSSDADVRGTGRHRRSFSGNVIGVDGGIPVAYGTTRLPARIIDYRLDTSTGVTPFDEMYIPVVFCHGSRDNLGIAEIGAIQFDDRNAFNTAGTAQSPFTTTVAKIAKLLGTSTQSVVAESINSTTLASITADWSATDDGRGLASALFFVKWDQDIFTGLPKIVADIKGNHVEDTRSEVNADDIAFATAADTITRATGNFTTDGWVAGDRVAVSGSTSNDGSYTINTVSATQLTVAENLTNEGSASGRVLKRWASVANGADNPAMIVRDYLLSTIYGAAVPATAIDQTSFETMADYCDESVTIPDGAGGSTTQNRFTCNGWVNTDQSVEQNLAELLSSCRGNLIYEGGTFRLLITREVTPATVVLDKSNIIGDWEFGSAGIQNRYNQAEASFVDANKRYFPEVVRWPNPGAANAFLTSDNSFVSELQTSLPFTQSVYMAEQILMTQIKESRQGIKVGVTGYEELLQYQIGDVAPVRHATPGWGTRWVEGETVAFADANPDTITRGTGDFTADGWVVGEKVLVDGSAANDGVYTIATVGTSSLTLVAGDALVAAGAASGITLNNPKLFWVETLAIAQGGKGSSPLVRLGLSEYSTSVYDHDSQSDADAEPDTDLPDTFTIAAPTGVTATHGAADALKGDTGEPIPSIKLVWTDSTSPFVSHYEIAARTGTAAVDLDGGIIVGRAEPGVGEHKFPFSVSIPDGVNIAVGSGVRAVGIGGQRSGWTQDDFFYNLDDFQQNASFGYTTVNSAASPYTVLVTDKTLGVNSSGGTVSLNLPACSTSLGRIIYIEINTGGNAVTLVRNGSDSINGVGGNYAMGSVVARVRLSCQDSSNWVTF